LLLKGGTVLSMDPQVGDFVDGDVLIEGTKIVEVGRDLGADATEIHCSNCIVIPGFVNSHIHMFQTALRGYWADALAPDHFSQSRDGQDAIFHMYSPDDVYMGEYAGALECLDGGITTAVDTSQCSYTPEHSDAAIRGLRDSGMRAMYAFTGMTGGNIPAPNYAFPQDLSRLQREMSGAGDSLVTLAMGTPLNADNITLAREYGVPIFSHVNNAATGKELEDFARAGLLGPDNTYIHCNSLEVSTWEQIAATGGQVSLSNIVEQTLHSGMPALQPATGPRYSAQLRHRRGGPGADRLLRPDEGRICVAAKSDSGSTQHPASPATQPNADRLRRRAAGMAAAVGSRPSALGISPRLPRRPRGGLVCQPQTPAATLARGGPAGAAMSPP